MNGNLRCADGFTLVETMIAMFLLTFIVAEMGMVDVASKRSAMLARQMTQANALADDAVEKNRNSAYTSLQLPISGLSESCASAANVATCTSTSGIYTRQRIVTPLDVNNNVTTLALSGKADVAVTVTFTDARGIPQRVSVASVITKY